MNVMKYTTGWSHSEKNTMKVNRCKKSYLFSNADMPFRNQIHKLIYLHYWLHGSKTCGIRICCFILIFALEFRQTKTTLETGNSRSWRRFGGNRLATTGRRWRPTNHRLLHREKGGVFRNMAASQQDADRGEETSGARRGRRVSSHRSELRRSQRTIRAQPSRQGSGTGNRWVTSTEIWKIKKMKMLTIFQLVYNVYWMCSFYEISTY